MDEELKAYLESMQAKTTGEFEAMRAEMRDRFEVVEHKIALVAEGVLGANERIDRLEGKVEHLAGRIDYLSVKVNHLAAEMNSDFGDLRSLMKYSYTDLDQRVRNLEQR